MRSLSFVLDCLFGPGREAETKIQCSVVEHGPEALRLRGLHALDGLIAAGRYDADPAMKALIRRFKFSRSTALADPLATLLLHAIQGSSLTHQASFTIIPVPLFWTRQWLRGFNQSMLLARALGTQTGWSVAHPLRRMRSTGRQTLRTRRERLIALIDAFECTHTNPLPHSVLLIDDLSTTGATLEECARTLKKAGVQTVIGAVVAVG